MAYLMMVEAKLLAFAQKNHTGLLDREGLLVGAIRFACPGDFDS